MWCVHTDLPIWRWRSVRAAIDRIRGQHLPQHILHSGSSLHRYSYTHSWIMVIFCYTGNGKKAIKKTWRQSIFFNHYHIARIICRHFYLWVQLFFCLFVEDQLIRLIRAGRGFIVLNIVHDMSCVPQWNNKAYFQEICYDRARLASGHGWRWSSSSPWPCCSAWWPPSLPWSMSFTFPFPTSSVLPAFTFGTLLPVSRLIFTEHSVHLSYYSTLDCLSLVWYLPARVTR